MNCQSITMLITMMLNNWFIPMLLSLNHLPPRYTKTINLEFQHVQFVDDVCGTIESLN